MPTPTATAKIHAGLKAWEQRAFNAPAPVGLGQEIRDQVRRAIAAQLAADTNDAPLQPATVEAQVIALAGEGLSGPAKKALQRLVHGIVDEITVQNEPKEMTRLLWVWKGVESDQAKRTQVEEELFQALYSQLYSIAARKLYANQRLRHKIDPRELLNELYMRLSQANVPQLPANRIQFRAMAAKALDNLIRDIYKASNRQKRFKTRYAITITNAQHPAAPGTIVDTLACLEALDKLGEISARQRDVVWRRWWQQESVADTAEALGLSEMTIKRDYSLGMENLRKILGLEP